MAPVTMSQKTHMTADDSREWYPMTRFRRVARTSRRLTGGSRGREHHQRARCQPRPSDGGRRLQDRRTGPHTGGGRAGAGSHESDAQGPQRLGRHERREGRGCLRCRHRVLSRRRVHRSGLSLGGARGSAENRGPEGSLTAMPTADIKGPQRRVLATEVRPLKPSQGDAGIPLTRHSTLPFTVWRQWIAPAGHYAERFYIVDKDSREIIWEAVSYTHLTLPTIYSV